MGLMGFIGLQGLECGRPVESEDVRRDVAVLLKIPKP